MEKETFEKLVYEKIEDENLKNYLIYFFGKSEEKYLETASQIIDFLKKKSDTDSDFRLAYWSYIKRRKEEYDKALDSLNDPRENDCQTVMETSSGLLYLFFLKNKMIRIGMEKYFLKEGEKEEFYKKIPEKEKSVLETMLEKINTAYNYW